MGIIREILSEAVVRDKDWASLLRLLDEGGFKDLLIPHEIKSDGVVQYNLDGYNKLDGVALQKAGRFNGRFYPAIDKITYYLMKNGKSALSQLILNHMEIFEDNNDNTNIRIWFDMNKDIKFDTMGIGSYNYVHGIGDDKVRKVEIQKGRNTTLYNHLPYLSEKYPDLFFKTIKTKSGYVQDKFVASYFTLPGDEGVQTKFFTDFEELRDRIYDVINNEKLSSKLDLHEYNVGYDKDGKLKAFDI